MGADACGKQNRCCRNLTARSDDLAEIESTLQTKHVEVFGNKVTIQNSNTWAVIERGFGFGFIFIAKVQLNSVL